MPQSNMPQSQNSSFWSPIVHDLKPYTPGEQPKNLSASSPLVKLNTNENPYPPSPKALQAIHQANTASLRLYPDPHAQELRDELARSFQLSADQVFVGNGSDEVLAHLFQAFFQKPEPILFPDITYSFYPVYAKLYRVEYQTVPLKADFSLDIEGLAVNNGGIIFPNPNAPTGQLVGLDAIRTVLERQRALNPNSVVVIDEAYIDFGGASAACLVEAFPNLLVVQTFSKSRSLAGLRVGYALGQAHLIDALERVKNSFNSYPLDRLALAGAVAALQDPAYFQSCCEKIVATREQTIKQLCSLGFEIIPSAANFLMIKHPKFLAENLFHQLRNDNIIVRYFSAPRIDQYLRVTIGTDDEMARFLTAVERIVSC